MCSPYMHTGLQSLWHWGTQTSPVLGFLFEAIFFFGGGGGGGEGLGLRLAEGLSLAVAGDAWLPK